MKKLTCTRCNGMGILPHLTHVEGGRCFGCGGTGSIFKDNSKPVPRNKIEYILFLDENSDPICVRKLDKPTTPKKAIDLIITNQYSLTEVAYLTGFSDQSHFTRIFKQHTGKSPSAYKKELAKGKADTKG